MNRNSLNKIKRELKQMRVSPHNVAPRELISIAQQLGRSLANRGKEPNYVRLDSPKLSPPLSIPNHGAFSPGTVRSIVDALLSDVDGWDIYLMESENDD